MITKEKELETLAVDIGVSKLREAFSRAGLPHTPGGTFLIGNAVPQMAKLIEDFRDDKRRRLGKVKNSLILLSPDEMAYIALVAVLEKGKGTYMSMARGIGNAIDQQLMFRKIEPYIESDVWYSMSPKNRYLRLRDFNEYSLTSDDKIAVGSDLLVILEAVGIIQIMGRGGNSGYDVKVKRDILDHIKTSNERVLLLKPRFLPLVVEPKPWEHYNVGGYWFIPNIPLVNTGEHKGYKELRELMMPQVYEAINKLQKVKFRLDRRVLKVWKHAYENGLALGGLPLRYEDIPEVPPLNYKGTQEEFKEFRTTPEYRAWAKDAQAIYKLISTNEAAVYNTALIKWVIDNMEEYDSLWFTHYLDFRGRMYYKQSFVSPQTQDYAKHLLEFAEGKPIDDPKWLKIHLANTWGEDKISYDDRIAWVDKNESLILSVASDPLDDLRWEKADEPWGFLQACFEYRDYLADPLNFQSHIIVYVDGSNNGTQHASALLLDEVTAEQVNLIPSDKPQDIYQVVADEVLRLLKESDELESVLWEPLVTRTLVKRPTMTLSYGVTQRGIQDQVREHIVKDISPNPRIAWGELCPFSMSHMTAWITPVILEALGNKCRAAIELKEWFQEVAKIINKKSERIDWITPSGFKVIQHYKKYKLKRLKTLHQQKIQFRYYTQLPDTLKNKQVLGLSPNFIHSLDASHLNKIIRKFDGDISIIHDSCGVHVGDVDELQKVIRDTFVEMYSQDILLETKEDWEQRYGVELPPLPSQGMLDLSSVTESLYFFA